MTTKHACIICDEPATWIRCTQFDGNLPYCDEHARMELDFGDDDSYKYWVELKNEDN